MSQRQVLMVFGVWLVILPFLGFPLDWENELIACWNGGSNVSQLAKRFGVARATVRAILGPVKLAESESHK